METKIFTKVSLENGASVLHLDENYNIAKISITLDGKDKGSAVNASVHYAKNRVTTDLIWFSDATGKTNSVLEFIPNAPASASDIYVTLSDDDAFVSKIELFMAEDVDLSKCYPMYVDKNLGENYYLDSVTVHMPQEGYSQYTIYTSLDGRDFDEVARKSTKESCPVEGESYLLNGKEARIIRVYIEYNSLSSEAVLENIEFSGTKSGTEVKYPREINIPDYKDSKYNVPVTEADTINEVYSIIRRCVGEKYTSWFSFNIKNKSKYDYFELSCENGKINVTGNNGVSLATGVNYYLKYFCKVNISQVGDQVKMPDRIVALEHVIHKETKAKIRYAYNYCTLSYSMAFWGEKEWRNELDWLALNGVNLVLDATAQEEVWRRFLKGLGYSHDAIKKFIAGPAYYAWAYMANLTGFGGPVHDSWFEERCELARKNHLIMRSLGIKPILQGYSGMVPIDICDYDSTAEVIPQGTWCSFRRPDMLKTTSDCFKEYAHKFYTAQKEVYGDVTEYFATDPFHEGGITLDMSPREISRNVLSAMLKENPDSVWIIQSWQNNPTSELLLGLEDVENGKNHALILDLYAEKNPNYPKGCSDNPSFGYDREFNYTPWLYCMLNNFGGRLGLHGHLDNLAREIPKVFTECKAVAGIGITPEASVNNPVLYDFFFESVWCDDINEPMREISLDEWLENYALRRYGKESESAFKAWHILKDTVYRAEYNMLGQGAPESIVNARPALAINAASTWGNSVISYDKELFEEAGRLLLKDYDILKESPGYKYDVITVWQQIFSNRAQKIHDEMASAFKNGDINEFTKYSDEFLMLIDKMDKLTSCSEYYLLGRWVEQAKALATNADDFTKRLYELNAKALITTWGAYNQAEIGGLHDYSNRQWSGLIGDFYKLRWQKWIDARALELKGEKFEEESLFELEWAWARRNTVYASAPQDYDLTEILE